jgi:hypothetical protein
MKRANGKKNTAKKTSGMTGKAAKKKGRAIKQQQGIALLCVFHNNITSIANCNGMLAAMMYVNILLGLRCGRHSWF